jgi:stage II sporulation protein AA (anti-sigma F factor antagonist)
MNARERNGTAPPAVEVELHAGVGTAIVTLRGEHDINTEPRVSEALACAGEHPRVLVDLSECTFADSSLINALVNANTAIRQREGLLEVVIPPEASAARRIAELARLDEIVRVHSARDGVRLPVDGGAA